MESGILHIFVLLLSFLACVQASFTLRIHTPTLIPSIQGPNVVKMADTEAVLLEAIKKMDGSVGYDAIIICTSNLAQEEYWQKRLEATKGRTARAGAVILAVHEDWDAGGAGNGLGTLYAYTKARKKALDEFKVDLDVEMEKGWSVAM